MALKKDAPLVNRLAHALRVSHARSPGGVHANAAAGGGCDVCAMLREAAVLGLIDRRLWPSVIVWDGDIYNGAESDNEAASPASGEGQGGGT